MSNSVKRQPATAAASAHVETANTQARNQPRALPMRDIRTREDLSFTCRAESGCLVNWEVPHDPNAKWGNGRLIGRRMFEEVEALALTNELDSFHAMVFAMNNPNWCNRGAGIETGFSEAMAAAAILGIRMLLAGADRFDFEAEILRSSEEEGDVSSQGKKKSAILEQLGGNGHD